MTTKTKLRCAIYTRKSTEEGLEQDFNSLDAQREACEAFIASQAGLGWKLCRRSTTMAACQVLTWNALIFRRFWTTFETAGSTLWSSTR